MKDIIFICAVCLLVSGSYGSDDPDGVGVFSYQDSTGNRANSFIPQPSFFRPPLFRRPFQKPFYRRAFDDSVNQKLAYDAARKAFDLTTNWAGYNPYFAPSRFPFGGAFPGFGGIPGGQGFPRGQEFPGAPAFPDFQMPNFGRSGDNSAFASAAIGDDFTHQVAEINPANPNNPNINKFLTVSGNPSGGFNSVSSSSYASSSDINGEKKASRGAETIVNLNGVVTKHTVHS